MNFQQQSPGRNGSPFPVEKGLKAVTASSLLLLAACLLLGRAAPALNTAGVTVRGLSPMARLRSVPHHEQESPSSPLLVEELFGWVPAR